MPRQIAFLRGINLGAHRRVAMPELRAVLGELGLEHVVTHGQSGNVVFGAEDPPAALEERLGRELGARLGLECAVLVRTRDQLAAVVASDPLREVAGDPRRHVVSFLSAEVAPEIAGALVAGDFGAERVAVAGREIHSWHPDGIQRSPLAQRLTDTKLGVTATARNWRTVTRMLDLADA